MARSAEEAAAKNNMKELYNITRQLSQSHFRNNVPVKSKDGKLLVTMEDQLLRWKEHFEEVLNISRDGIDLVEIPNAPTLKMNINPPSINEIYEAIKAMKNGKAAGADGIPAELFKADATTTATILHPLFTDIWTTETFPQDWNTGIIIKIPKKGDLSNCNNWRGINLLCASSKIFMRVILNRMMLHMEQKLRKEQAGFRPQRSCIDQINTIRIIIEQSAELGSKLYALFVDYEKAFDSIDRNCIWTTLKNRGLPEKLISLIRESYNQFQCRVLHDGQQTEPFTTASGVRQGCLLSPLIFLIVLDEVLIKTVEGKARGITWKLTRTLEDLDYADDICLLAHKQSDMQHKVNDLVNESTKVGLKINIEKTKELRINSNNSTNVSVGGTDIELVDSFTYLGSNIAADGGALKDIDARIQKARGAYSRLNNIWKSNEITPKTKMKIFNASVKSVLLYGCETWLVTVTSNRKLQVFVNRCLRNILRIWWPKTISNQELWKEAGQDDINIQIRRRKFGWIGHTIRNKKNEICNEALEYNPQGKRKQGRPKNTWRRTTLNEAGRSFKELRPLAENRVRWKLIVDTICP